jgi:hypothetical protein
VAITATPSALEGICMPNLITPQVRTSSLIVAEIPCPVCGRPIAGEASIVVETLWAASNRLAKPELLVICGSCQRRIILSLRPAAKKAGSS